MGRAVLSTGGERASLAGRHNSLLLLSLLLLLGAGLPLLLLLGAHHHQEQQQSGGGSSWTLEQAVARVAVDKTVIVCTVNQAYLPFFHNWLTSVARQGRHQAVLVIAEDAATLRAVQAHWPGHAVLSPDAADAAAVTTTFSSSSSSSWWRWWSSSSPSSPPPHKPPPAAHKFGSRGFYNLTSRRPRHLLRILDLGYSVLYNDVDMVWVADPFPYFRRSTHADVYFADDAAAVKPWGHSSALPLPPPGAAGTKKRGSGRPYVCTCLLFLRPTAGAKLLMRAWIRELEARPWAARASSNDQPAFNWALVRTAGRVDVHLLPQAGFPPGGLYFKNRTWREETRGQHVVLHSNYVVGVDKKVKRLRDHGLWFLPPAADNTSSAAAAATI